MGDYLRALRRRLWLALLAALLISIPGAWFVMRLPNVYRVAAHVRVTPQRFDPTLAVIVGSGVAGHHDPAESERFIPHSLARLHTKDLADRVLKEVGPSPDYAVDPTKEITSTLAWKRLYSSEGLYEVSMEGTDPDRAAAIMNKLLDEFRMRILNESTLDLSDMTSAVASNLELKKTELVELDRKIREFLGAHPIFTPDGRNILQDEYVEMKTSLASKVARLEQINLQRQVMDFAPKVKRVLLPPQLEQQLARLRDREMLITNAMTHEKTVVRRAQTDPAVRHHLVELRSIREKIGEIEQFAEEASGDGGPEASGLLVDFASQEIQEFRREVRKQLEAMEASMPFYQEYLSLTRTRTELEREVAATSQNLSKFQLLAKRRDEPVEIWERATAPPSPVRPRRMLWIGLVALAGLVVGMGLVCLLESLDHSIRMPDQIANGLVLPIYGVIPRMRRVSTMLRGGHLWAAGDPTSLEADSFRNLRASIMCDGAAHQEIASLLVTSAKAGEGKSTTALNLAAACAWAGERTLLIDVDLRRSSLAEAFGVDAGDPGLVDALRGDLPWSSAVARCAELPNLFYLPLGDPTGVPVEVLGTRELRAIVDAATEQFDRVILDGPAVLGLADCRMLGRLVDASLFVVRSGAADLAPARWAKEALEQSRIRISGVVFNDMCENLHHWSNGGSRASITAQGADGWDAHRALTGPVLESSVRG
jgi:capsular exopolysaccharide synthesis family protein